MLNRALLARQGLLEAPDVPVVEAVESIGALQAQHWPALPVALWSRLPEFEAADLYGALDAGQLVVGTLLRGTLHMVSAREHPSYAVVTDMSGVTAWHRTKAEPSPKVETLRSKLVAYTASGPRTVDETCDFIEAWLAKHPGVIEEPELAAQRSYKWRPFRTSSAFVRAPADGRWGGKTPAAFLSASCPPGTADSPAPEDALAAVIRCHLRAFGPAAAEDVASWTGLRTPAVREAISRFGAALVEFSDEAGRTLYDLPDAPRPDPGVPAPVRFLPAFDSVLLAYDAKHRGRPSGSPSSASRPPRPTRWSSTGDGTVSPAGPGQPSRRHSRASGRLTGEPKRLVQATPAAYSPSAH